jgi:TRAP-type C4-dicarboxylate transport system permease small subunit
MDGEVMLRRLATISESLAAALLIGAVALNCANVIARYVFGRPIVTAEEIMQFANVWIVMLAAAAVTRLDIHLRMDVLKPARPSIARLFELAIALLAIGLTGYVVFNGVRIVMITYDIGQRSVAAGLPLVLIYLAVPTGFACMLLFVVNRAVRLARGQSPDEV